MTPSNDIFVELRQLVTEATRGFITKERMDRLNQILADSGEARRYYLELVDIFVLTEHLCSDAAFFLDDDEFDLSETQSQDLLLLELAKEEKTAPGIQIVKTIEKPVATELTTTVKQEREISRLAIYSLTVSAAAILLLMVMVLSTPVLPVVGVLTDTINAEWVGTTDIPANYDVLRQGEMTLVRGLAEITFDDGAVVVVEAPAVFELKGPNNMFLASGKISAVVSEYAIGFTVDTPSARIVDLGTEFGVRVEGSGTCNLHMFQGKANLIAGQKGQIKRSQIVNLNQARSVDLTSGAIKIINLEEKNFVRHINSEEEFVWRGEELCLADILGGGTGFGTPSPNRCIDPTSGKIYTRILSREQKGTGQYFPVPGIPYIDGVFSLNGETKPIQVSSQGHKFSGFEKTSGVIWTDITTSIRGLRGIKLGEITYGTPEHPCIYSRVNAGITYDLDKIRNGLEGLEIESLASMYGNSSTAPTNSVSHFWVIIDGELRWKSEDITKESGANNLDIKITEEDHFLTLAVTDGGDGWIDDWCVFVNPQLIIK